jgi:co-chaperonin GroES (HSP10)
MIEPVTHKIVIKPFLIEEEDEAYKAAKRMGLDLSLEKTKDREQAAVDRGTVVAIGPTAFKDFGADNPLTVGDEIVYARHAGKAVEDIYTKEKFVIILDDDVCAIFRKEA